MDKVIDFLERLGLLAMEALSLAYHGGRGEVIVIAFPGASLRKALCLCLRRTP